MPTWTWTRPRLSPVEQDSAPVRELKDALQFLEYKKERPGVAIKNETR
jgi:hypothetical protein